MRLGCPPDEWIAVLVDPLPGEALSSWFTRLAHVNHEKVQGLASRLLGRGRPTQQRDIDRGAARDLMRELARVTALPAERIAGMTLPPPGELHWTGAAGLTDAWIRPDRSGPARKPAHGQQICPECLREDRIPYMRLTWRLAFHCVCPEHSIVLADRCSDCTMPIHARRSDLGKFGPSRGAGLLRCWHCQVRYSEMRGARRPVQDSVALHQRHLLQAFREGSTALPGQHLRADAFFTGLRVLWAFFERSGDLERGLAPSRRLHTPIELLSSDRCAELLAVSADLFQDWPRAFIDKVKALGLASYMVTKSAGRTLKGAPFWLMAPVSQALDRSMYVPAPEEILEAARIAIRETANVKVGDICQRLNLRTRCSARVSAVLRERYGSGRLFCTTCQQRFSRPKGRWGGPRSTCPSCVRAARTCLRCSRPVPRAGKLVDGQAVCNACAPHFRPLLACERCGQTSRTLSTYPKHRIARRVCPSCFGAQVKSTCSNCRKHRLVASRSTEGRPLCAGCLPSAGGMLPVHACTSCGTTVAGRGTARCIACLNIDRAARQTLSGEAALAASWLAQPWRDFVADMLLNHPTDAGLEGDLRKALVFFKHVASVFDSSPSPKDYIFAIDSRLRRKHLLASRWIEQGIGGLPAAAVEQAAEERRIRQMFDAIEDEAQSGLLHAFHATLDRKDVSARTRRMYLRVAADFIRETGLRGVRQPSDDERSTFLAARPGQQANASAWFSFLRTAEASSQRDHLTGLESWS